MNRLIAFRAWDIDKQIMIYDNIFKRWSSHGSTHTFPEHYDVKIGESAHALVYKIGNSLGTLMQFTGAKNKLNEDIYEGDIVKAEDGDVFEIKYMSLDCCGGYTLDSGMGFNFYSNDPKKLITIGNIFEMKCWEEL